MKILALSGYVPEHICDITRFSQYSGDRNITHYCGYASDFVSKVLEDDSFDGAVYPKTCDSTRIISSYLSNALKFNYQLCVPSYGTIGSSDFFADQIKSYKNAVELYYGIPLNDIDIRAEIINNRNKRIRETYDNLPNVSYLSYIEQIHDILNKPLYEQSWKTSLGNNQNQTKNVFIVGSFISNLNIIRCIEEAGLRIVGDCLPESGRMVSAKSVDLNEDIYSAIAKSVLSMRLSPTLNSFRNILCADFEEIKKKKVQGIIFVTQKYCESYDYLYVQYKKMADDLGIPIIKIAVNNTEDNGKVALAIEAFTYSL